MLKPVPVTLADMLALPVPVTERVTLWVLLLPTVTLPKLRVVGLTPSTGRMQAPPGRLSFTMAV